MFPTTKKSIILVDFAVAENEFLKKKLKLMSWVSCFLIKQYKLNYQNNWVVLVPMTTELVFQVSKQPLRQKNNVNFCFSFSWLAVFLKKSGNLVINAWHLSLGPKLCVSLLILVQESAITKVTPNQIWSGFFHFAWNLNWCHFYHWWVLY